MMWEHVRLVRQSGAWGCAIAVMAMVTGWSYRDVRSLFPDEVETAEGLSQWEVLQAISWFGYGFRVFGVGKYRYWPSGPALTFGGKPDHLAQLDFPPVAGDLCILTVAAAEGGLHLCVLLPDGTVLDPLHGVSALSDYVEPVWVAAIHPVAPRPAPES